MGLAANAVHLHSTENEAKMSATLVHEDIARLVLGKWRIENCVVIGVNRSHAALDARSFE